jgi:hypothetical protein
MGMLNRHPAWRCPEKNSQEERDIRSFSVQTCILIAVLSNVSHAECPTTNEQTDICTYAGVSSS